MRLLETIHSRYVQARRVRTLSEQLSRLIPDDARILDVGCGDGILDAEIQSRRPDVEIRGVDTHLRGQPRIEVDAFDGRNIPFEAGSFDIVMFVDVLHHTDDPMTLLREATRVSRRALLIKDHLKEGFLAETTLRLMDRTGNERYQVALPFNYWSRGEWRAAFAELGLDVNQWTSRLQLYPWPASWIFERGLHFVALLLPTQGDH